MTRFLFTMLAFIGDEYQICLSGSLSALAEPDTFVRYCSQAHIPMDSLGRLNVVCTMSVYLADCRQYQSH